MIVRLLLDTHILIWWVTADRRLKRPIRDLIARQTADVAVSAASIWELAIKKALGRIDIELGDLIEAMRADSFVELPVTFAHTAAVESLPRHHDDPFDRLLVAQAITDERQLITADGKVLQYGSVPHFVSLPA